MLFDLVSFSTATTGTGTVTAGSATSGFRTMAAASIPDGTTVEYAIEDGSDRETGTGVTGSSATTLTRTLASSTTGSLLNLSGSATVFLTPIAKTNVIQDVNESIRVLNNSAANACSVPLVNYLYQNADYALSNVATEQKIFNQSTNGTLTLPTGFYRFKTFFWVTGMSATSGSAGFDPIGAGTAVCSDFAYDSYGLDNSTQPNAVLAISGVGSVTQQSGANVVLAGTGTGMRVSIQGVFRIDTAGTIIPSLTLVTASAATLKAGSHFIIEKIGEASENTVGAWT